LSRILSHPFLFDFNKGSFTFFWVRGGSYERFVEVTPRLFISMEGTLYFAYNLREDDDR